MNNSRDNKNIDFLQSDIMGTVVSDKMRYSLKPIAVECKAHVLTIPSIGTKV